MYSIGYDIGSSSVKAAIIDISTGKLVISDFYPREELNISSPQSGWAEQDPGIWWDSVKNLTLKLLDESEIHSEEIKCIGISYQMHGLVIVDKDMNVLRPSIIWCDSRAVETGKDAFNKLGREFCLGHMLNSPGNFTASKLKWVKENEPEIYNKIYKFMLPGDFIAMKMTGLPATTISGLSEGILWDFSENRITEELVDFYKIDENLISELKPTFGEQGTLTNKAAEELDLKPGTPVSYRAGDQPNNAFSLNVLNAGEIAATAGTSGVIYGVTDQIKFDPLSRVNQFAHVNYSKEKPMLGILLCINGTGILYSWLRKLLGNLSYEQMNELASDIEIGSGGLNILPFGNGAERVLENRNIGCHFSGLDFNRHTKAHMFRAAQEGIAFSLKYGIEIMHNMGLEIKIIRAGKSNMFLSNVFTQTMANIINAEIQLYNTDGAQGAARGAALGAGYYKTPEDAFNGLSLCSEYYPNKDEINVTEEAYSRWLDELNVVLEN